MIARQRLTLADIGTVPSGNSPAHSWRPISLVDLDLEGPVQPTLAGVGYPGSRHHVSGEPESLKTWLMLTLCHHEITAGHGVIYLDFENGARSMLGRLRDLGIPNDTIRAQFVYVQPDEPIGASAVIRDDLERMLLTVQPSLCVVDSMAGALALHDLDPNSARDVEKFSQTVIEPPRASGAAIFTLDHLPKNKDNRGRFATGSERKIGVTDVHLGIETLQTFGRGRTGKAKIVVHKDRLGWLPRPKAAELELFSDPDTHHVTYRIVVAEHEDDGSTFRPTLLMERVSQHLETAGGAVSRSAVIDGVKGRTEWVRRAIDLLLAEHFITEEDGPHGARLCRSQRPYREADDNPVPPDPIPVPDRVPDTLNDPVPPRPPLTGGRDWVEVPANPLDNPDLVPTRYTP